MNYGMIFDTFLILGLFLAAVLQVALLRDYAFHESKHDESYRWLGVAGFVGLGSRYMFLMYAYGTLRLDVSWQEHTSMSLITLSVVGLSLNKVIAAARRYPGGRRVNDPPIRTDAPPEPEPRHWWFSSFSNSKH